MQETIRTRHASGPGLGGGNDPFAVPESDGMAHVMHWPYSERIAVAGMTVQQVRERYRDRFVLHPDAQAVLDGNRVGSETVIGPGQTLIFIRRVGEKGRAAKARRRPRPAARMS